ncbi:hypothetical protein [Gordonia westfalica]|uniref:hypothetical protein n=1 Tax=Gordonia westfalica TaxID=158898 RepID=UPI0011136A23|nr:hypothetical protein [Gordonia westfalica]
MDRTAKRPLDILVVVLGLPVNPSGSVLKNSHRATQIAEGKIQRPDFYLYRTDDDRTDLSDRTSGFGDR